MSGARSRHHLTYGTADTELYRQWVVCTIEKNGSGWDGVDLEFRKRLSHGHFEPDGRVVAEQLLDERVHLA